MVEHFKIPYSRLTNSPPPFSDCHGAPKKAWILGNFGDSCDYTCSTYFGAGCSPDASGTYAWYRRFYLFSVWTVKWSATGIICRLCNCRPLTATDLSNNVLSTVLSYSTLTHITISCTAYGLTRSDMPLYYPSYAQCYYSYSATPLGCSATTNVDLQRFCPCAKGKSNNLFSNFPVSDSFPHIQARILTILRFTKYS